MSDRRYTRTLSPTPTGGMVCLSICILSPLLRPQLGHLRVSLPQVRFEQGDEPFLFVAVFKRPPLGFGQVLHPLIHRRVANLMDERPTLFYSALVATDADAVVVVVTFSYAPVPVDMGWKRDGPLPAAQVEVAHGVLI